MPTSILNISPNPMMAERFLGLLYPVTRGYLTIVRKRGEGMFTDYFDISSTSMDQVAGYACRLAEVQDVWFGVGLRRAKVDGWIRGNAESVSVIPGLWTDCDIKGSAHKEPKLPPDEE